MTTMNAPAPVTALGIWAHPDDEAYLSAGLMTRVTSAGGTVACVHATLGERGTQDPSSWPPERLGPLRARELADSLRHFGVQDRTVLGLPDGRCTEIPPQDVVPRLVDTLERLRPTYVVTFGPDGFTGHSDHSSVSGWATAAWSAAGRRGQLLYVATPHSFLDRFADLHHRFDLVPVDAVGVADTDVDLRVRLTRSELKRKRAALRAHASQTTELARAMGEPAYRRYISVEYFRFPTQAEIEKATSLLAAPQAGGPRW